MVREDVRAVFEVANSGGLVCAKNAVLSRDALTAAAGAPIRRKLRHGFNNRVAKDRIRICDRDLENGTMHHEVQNV